MILMLTVFWKLIEIIDVVSCLSGLAFEFKLLCGIPLTENMPVTAQVMWDEGLIVDDVVFEYTFKHKSC